MSIDAFINNLAGIGTFISSVIALIALRELIKQRRAMYRPSLFLNEFTLSVKGNPRANQKSFYYYKLHNLHEPEDKNNNTPHSIGSQVFFENIGYGIANQVNFKWEFDYKKAVKILCNLDNDLKYEFNSKDKSVLLTLNEDYFDSYRFEDIGKEKNIDFIKPENLQINKKPLSIPMLITSIHMDYVLVKNKMNTETCAKFKYEEFKNFPKPKLTISYKDISGKVYKSHYKFNLTCGNSFYQKHDYEIDTRTDYALLTFKAE